RRNRVAVFMASPWPLGTGTRVATLPPSYPLPRRKQRACLAATLPRRAGAVCLTAPQRPDTKGRFRHRTTAPAAPLPLVMGEPMAADGVRARPAPRHRRARRDRDDWDRDDFPEDVPFPKLVSTAGIIWIVFGGVILVTGAIRVLGALLLGSAVGAGGGALFTG